MRPPDNLLVGEQLAPVVPAKVGIYSWGWKQSMDPCLRRDDEIRQPTALVCHPGAGRGSRHWGI